MVSKTKKKKTPAKKKPAVVVDHIALLLAELELQKEQRQIMIVNLDNLNRGLAVIAGQIAQVQKQIVFHPYTN